MVVAAIRRLRSTPRFAAFQMSCVCVWLSASGLDTSDLSQRQIGMMIGNAWSINVSARVLKHVFLALGLATADELRDPWEEH